jgi:uncharacterized membrane protein YfcA
MSRRYAAREWRRIGVWFAVAAAVTLAGGWLTATERRDPWIVGIIGALFLLRAGHAFWRAWRADRPPLARAAVEPSAGVEPTEPRAL